MEHLQNSGFYRMFSVVRSRGPLKKQKLQLHCGGGIIVKNT